MSRKTGLGANDASVLLPMPPGPNMIIRCGLLTLPEIIGNWPGELSAFAALFWPLIGGGGSDCLGVMVSLSDMLQLTPERGMDRLAPVRGVP